ncbi:MAG: calycin-like domain-containing protein [Prevotellaceae bacterium]|jgi:hypothetical protein|nr:calycin-like domain-containing protein [Prevotellaceae bacterium]
MTNIFKTAMILSLGLAVAATGCNDDEKKAENYAKDIEGTYVGSISMGGYPVVPSDTIKVAAKGENTATLSMNTTIPNLPEVGNLTLDVSCDATITKEGSEYKVSGSTSIAVAVLGGTPLPVSINGTFTAAGVATLTSTVTMMNADGEPAPVETVFSGTKLK